MLYGEHLCAEDVPLKCACGVTATVKVVDRGGQLHGWYCRRCSYRVHDELRRLEKLARAIVRKGGP
jgi:hypothetical protein